jgi:SAM-dependent methyltransferase
VLDGDVDFYLAQARKSGGPVLDLACGTGRVAFPLARAGFDLTGLDRAPGMIAIARAKQRTSGLKNIRFVRGNMARFELRRRFGFVFIAYRAFQHLLTPKAQRSSLECIRRHLRKGGRLVVHLFDPRLEFCVPGSPAMNSRRPTAHDPSTGHDVALEVLDRHTDPLTQTFSERWHWTVSREGTTIQTYDDELRLRWTHRCEMRYLLELTGFAAKMVPLTRSTGVPHAVPSSVFGSDSPISLTTSKVRVFMPEHKRPAEAGRYEESASSSVRCCCSRDARSSANRLTPANTESGSRCASAMTSASRPPVNHWLSQSAVSE